MWFDKVLHLQRWTRYMIKNGVVSYWWLYYTYDCLVLLFPNISTLSWFLLSKKTQGPFCIPSFTTTWVEPGFPTDVCMCMIRLDVKDTASHYPGKSGLQRRGGRVSQCCPHLGMQSYDAGCHLGFQWPLMHWNPPYNFLRQHCTELSVKPLVFETCACRIPWHPFVYSGYCNVTWCI